MKLFGFNVSRAVEKDLDPYAALWRNGQLPFGATESGQNVTARSALRTLSAVNGACSLISDALASLPVFIARQVSSGGLERVQGTDVERVLHDLSYCDKELMLFNTALGGNGFARIIRGSSGRLDTLEPLHPSWVSVEAVNANYDNLRYQIQKPGEKPVTLTSEEVLHFRFRHIANQAAAEPPIVSSANAVGSCQAARAFGDALYRNGAVPRMVIKHPGRLKPDAAKRMKTAWQNFYGGADQAGKTAVLEEGMDISAIDLPNARDATMLESQVFNVHEIARLYSIPPSLLGETKDSSYSTSVEQSRQFAMYCLRPWTQRISSTLDHALLSTEQRRKGLGIHFDLAGLLRGHGTEEADYLARLTQSGIMTINESRNALGLQDVADGDVPLVPVNLSPLGAETDEDPDADLTV